MEIGVDFGDVIQNTASLKSLIAHELFKTRVNPEEFNKEYVVTKRRKLTPVQYLAMQILIYRTREYGIDRMKPVPEALDYLRKLIKDGDNLKIISERGKIEAELAQDWLKEVGIDIPFFGVGVKEKKAPYCDGLDVFLDDDLHQLEVMVNVPHRYLFCWMHNKDLIAPEGIKKVYSWLEFYQEIRALAKQYSQ